MFPAPSSQPVRPVPFDFLLPSSNLSTTSAQPSRPGTDQRIRKLVARRAPRVNTSSDSQPTSEVISESECVRFCSSMNELRKEKKLCDVDIIINDSTFSCHRAALASASEYFRSMFCGTFAESEKKAIELNDIDAECFKHTLEYMYCKKTAIDSNNSYDLLMMSRFFIVHGMEDYCVQFMENDLPLDCIIEVCIYADLNSKTTLYDKAVEYIAENFWEMRNHPTFLEISHRIFMDILKHSDKFEIENTMLQSIDDLILETIMRWNESRNVNRAQIVELISNVNKEKVGNEFLANLMCNDDTKHLQVRVTSVKDSKNIMHHFIYEENGEKWTLSRILQPTEKFNEKNIIVNGRRFTLSCLGWTNGGPINEFQVQESTSEDKTWFPSTLQHTLTKPPVCVASYTLSAVYSTIYLYDTDIITQSVIETELFPKAKDKEKSKLLFAYNYDLDQWFCVPRPKYEMANACVASVNNLLYLVGGSKCEQDFEFNAKYAQCYDHRTPCWVPLPEMSSTHINGAACSYKGKLYVLGGASKVFEVFDPRAGRWEKLKSASYDRSSDCFVNYHNALWAIGKSKAIPIERYYPVVDTWKSSTLECEYDGANVSVIDAYVF